jgi:hypothetical protein
MFDKFPMISAYGQLSTKTAWIEEALSSIPSLLKLMEFGPPLLTPSSAMTHHLELIVAFGDLNGLCSSKMEKKHISAVKKPYRHSERHRALGQILCTNQHLDNLKLAAAHRDFWRCRILRGTCVDSVLRSLNSRGNNSDTYESDIDMDATGARAR